MGNSQTFCRLCTEFVHNANTEALGSENQLVPIVDWQAVQFPSSLQVQAY